MPSLRLRLRGFVSASKITPHQEQTLVSVSGGDDFLENALQLLEPHRRAVIVRNGLNGPSSGITSTLDKVYEAARLKKIQSEERRWKCSIRGHEVRVADVADKVLSFLDRFKTIGDVASNASPVLAGLPWVGIRVILEIAVSSQRQMTALLQGLQTAFYATDRLRVYFDYFSLVPESTAKHNFQRAMTRCYAFLLQFFADAIQILERSSITSAFDAFFPSPRSLSFEAEFERLASQLDIEANNCDRVHSECQRQATELNRLMLRNALQEIRKLHETVHESIDMSRLPRAQGAAFDSYEEELETYCLPNTRADLLTEIFSWVRSPDGKRIFWLCGMAGTGKSTLARTVARMMSEDPACCKLAASFFFKRGEGDRGTAKRFVTTLAAQLSENVPGLRHLIVNVLKENPEISGKAMKEQFEKLIVEPLAKADPIFIRQLPLLIVVDALDECEDQGRVKNILHLLGSVHVSKHLRLFVTSRPEQYIRLGFAKMDMATHHDFVLHEVELSTIEHDIAVYVEHELTRVRRERNLPLDWPSQSQVHGLVQLAKPLFIYAATACRFISEGRSDPRHRLKGLLEQPTDISDNKLRQMYLTVLELIESENEHIDVAKELIELIGPLAVLETPLSIDATSTLLGLQSDDVAYQLDAYRSVLRVPEDETNQIQLLHLSFREFLCSSTDSKQHRFALDESEIHELLAARCLEILSQTGTLKMDLCSLRVPGIKRIDVSEKTIRNAIHPAVSYACRYWIQHVLKSGRCILDDGPAHNFLKQHFIHWLEALSWQGWASESIELITLLRSRVDVSRVHIFDMSSEASDRLIVSERLRKDLLCANCWTTHIGLLAIFEE